VVTSIKPNANYYKDSIPVSVTAQDDDSISSILIQISRNGIAWDDYDTITYSGNNKTETATANIILTEYQDEYLYVRGIAKDESGNTGDSTNSAPYTQYIVDKTAPEVPSGLTIEETTGLVDLNWDMGAENDIDGYIVYRSKDGEEYTKIKDNIHSINYIDRNVTPGETYYYKVAVKDIAGNISDCSESISATVTSDTESPEIQSYYPSNGDTIGPSKNLFQIMAQDNWKLDTISVKYSVNDSETLTELINQSGIDNYYKTVSATLPISRFNDGDEVKVVVAARDAMGHEIIDDSIVYVVDKKAPKISNIAVIGDEEKITINWTGNGEDDLAGYKLYRKSSSGNYTLIAQRSTVSSKDYKYEDYNVNNNDTYIYKVEAIDRTGNSSSIISESAWINISPTINAFYTAETVQEVNVEYEFDASSSFADRSVESYRFDFGDGTFVEGTQKKVVHKYGETGEYEAKLLITDEYGLSSEFSKSITVQEPQLVGEAKIKIVDSNGVKLSGIPVYFDLDNNSNNKKYTDYDGCVVFNGTSGRYSVGAYCDGYLPVKQYVVVSANETREITITMVKEPIVTGEFEVNRMTLDEIKAAGINISDPANQHVVRVDLQLSYGKEVVGMNYYTNGSTIYSGGTTIVDTSEGKRKLSVVSIGGNGTVGTGTGFFGNDTEYSVVAIMDVPVEASCLKEFFDVKLHILNHADSSFLLSNNVVSLNVPDGMTLMSTNSSSSSSTVRFDKLNGQEQKTITWTLRGDEEGEYNLSADYSATLDQFNEPIEAQFVTDEPIKVYGKSAIKVVAEINKDIMYGGLYFNLGIQNTSEAEMYLPSIDIINSLVDEYNNTEIMISDEVQKICYLKKVDVLKARIENDSGYSEYIDPNTKIESLSSRNTYFKNYVVYGSVDDNDRLYLVDAISKFASEEGFEVEIRLVDMDLFDVSNAEEKVDSIFSTPSKIEMYSYLLDRNNTNFAYMIQAENNEKPGNIAMESLYELGNLVFNLDADLITKDDIRDTTRGYILELMKDESFENAVAMKIEDEYTSAAESMFNAVVGTLPKSGQGDKDYSLADTYISNIKETLGNEKTYRSLGKALQEEGEDGFKDRLILLAESSCTAATIQYLKREIYSDEVVDAIDSAFFDEIKSLEYCGKAVDYVGDIIEDWNEANEVAYQFYRLSAIRTESLALVSIIANDYNINSDIRKEAAELKEGLEDGFDTQTDLFIQELAKTGATELSKEGIKLILKEIDSSMSLGSGLSFSTIYSALKLAFNVLDYTFGWETKYENVTKLRVLYNLTLAVRSEVLECQNSALNGSDNNQDFLFALKYLIKLRLLGEKEYVDTVHTEDKKLSLNPPSDGSVSNREKIILADMKANYSDISGRTHKELIEQIASVESLDAYYLLVRDRILSYRDSLYERNSVVYGLSDAPLVTINYDSLTTNEEFSGEYEYSFNGEKWNDCSGSVISLEKRNVGYYLWVRIKASENNLAGNITKVYVSVNPNTESLFPNDNNDNNQNHNNGTAITPNTNNSTKNSRNNNSKQVATNKSNTSSSGSPSVKYKNEWIDGKWYNDEGKQIYSGKLVWKKNFTGWWVEDTTGWYPINQWQKIDGVWYYFDSYGYMASNEWYNGYWFNEDGSWNPKYKMTWKCNSKGWWIEDKTGWWPSNQWQKIDGKWYYFNASGYMVTNTRIDGYWLGADGACQ